MSRRVLVRMLLCCLVIISFPLECFGQAKSRYVTLQYSDEKVLRKFNDRLNLGRKLQYYLRNKNLVTIEDEVLAKLDVIIEKAETVLDMFPADLHITVVLLSSRAEVAGIYNQKYSKQVDHIAYYSLSEDTIYISADDTQLRVIAHEVGHAIVDHYFDVRPPYTIHELMAQFTEKHIND